MTRRLVNALFALLILGSTPLLAEIVVTTTAELEAALTPANAGKRILVRAGEYVISQALTVPDDAALVGEGEMNFDGSGLPTGFEPAGRTVIRSTPALVGDVMTLGDGSSLRGLVIEDVAGRTGNLVAAYSRAGGDFISATVTECEILNPNPAGIVPAGPTGAGLVALTRNLNFGADPPAHEGAVVRVEMRRSIVRCPDGGTGVFAINFAAHGEIGLVLQRNLIGGQLILNGGVSRPDAVTGASIRVESQRNLYEDQSGFPDSLGWNLLGGSGSPAFPTEASTSNRLEMSSHDDTVRGFDIGVAATAGQRFLPTAAPSSSNRLELNLHGLRVQSAVADLMLFGARSFIDGVSPGDDNTLRVNLKKSTGSGPRANVYADNAGTPGVGNQLEIVGTEKSFVKSNDAFDPIPPAEFFGK